MRALVAAIAAGLLGLLGGCSGAPEPAPPQATPRLALDLPAEIHSRPAADLAWLSAPDVEVGPRGSVADAWVYQASTPGPELELDRDLVYRVTVRPQDAPGGLAQLVRALRDADAVQALFVWDASDLGGEDLAALAELPQLRALTLQNARRLDDSALESLVGLHGLRRLRISGAPDLTDRGLERLASLTGLRELSLKSCAGIRGTGLASLGRLPRLESLELSWAHGLDPEELSRLAEWPALRSLGLRGIRHLWGRDWRFLRRLEQLERLDLSGCGGIDEGVFRSLGKLTRLVGLDLAATPHEVQPLGEGSWLEHLVGLTDLRELDLGYSELGSDGQHGALLALSRLPKLEAIDLSSWELEARDHVTLQELPALRWLQAPLWGVGERQDPQLELPQVSGFRPYTSIESFADEAVPSLSGWVKLRELDLRSSDEVGDGTLQVLQGVPQLECLLLDGAQISDAGLSELLACRGSLRELSLRRCDRLTPGAARVLGQLGQLEVLDLRDCPWVDVGVLTALSQSTRLRLLLLRGTHVEPASVEALQRALPECAVSFGAPGNEGR